MTVQVEARKKMSKRKPAPARSAIAFEEGIPRRGEIAPGVRALFETAERAYKREVGAKAAAAGVHTYLFSGTKTTLKRLKKSFGEDILASKTIGYRCCIVTRAPLLELSEQKMLSASYVGNHFVLASSWAASNPIDEVCQYYLGGNQGSLQDRHDAIEKYRMADVALAEAKRAVAILEDQRDIAARRVVARVGSGSVFIDETRHLPSYHFERVMLIPDTGRHAAALDGGEDDE